MTPPRRPNVLFLMTDEHRFDVAGFAGDEVIRTPVLDDLARTGTVFESAYTPAPICVPGRQAMMAGQFPRHCGVERFGEDLAPGHLTFARQLSRFGYRTVAAGKLHHLGADQAQGWTHLIGMDSGVAPWHIADRDEESYRGLPTPATHKWSQVSEVKRAGIGRSPYVAHDEYTVAGAVQYVHEHFVDTYYDRAIPDVPLLLKVSLHQPHYPYLTPHQDLFDHYLNRVPLYEGQRLFEHPVLGGSRHVVRSGIEVSPREQRRAVAAYYAMIETADRLFGQVLDALRQAGQDIDEWVVVFTSDHGEMLGQHGVWEKQRFFEGSVRVPLLIRWPERFAARTVAHNVSLCDLFATLCELTGVLVPDGLDSRSVVPLMRGNPAQWDDEAISQFDGTRLMIKRGSLKYQFYGHEGPEVLFDLGIDPGEVRNLAAEPDYAPMMTAFRRRRDELGFPATIE
ncbi:MAG: sulfatase-like hydrolase/transferase [Pseudonocardia sp.]